ncbi:MAG: PAS domain-containing protein, partial [Candidatus Dormibacteria bacterium]
RRIPITKKRKKSHIPRKQKPKIPDALRNLDYKKIYSESPTPQRTISTRGIIIACNDAYAQAFGYTKKEIIGKSIFAFVPKEGTKAMQESFETWKKKGIVEDRKVWFKKKDGSTFPGLISANNIYDNKGHLIGSNTAIRDISETYTAHAKLEEREHQLREQYEQLEKANKLLSLTEQKYRNLYEKSPVLLRTIDFEGRITDCNEAYTKELGYTRDEVIGMTIYEHTAEKSMSAMRDEFEEWRKTHHVSQREIWVKQKDGSAFPSLLSGGSLYDEEGRVVGRTVALMNLTEIYNAKESLEKSEKQMGTSMDSYKN